MYSVVNVKVEATKMSAAHIFGQTTEKDRSPWPTLLERLLLNSEGRYPEMNDAANSP